MSPATRSLTATKPNALGFPAYPVSPTEPYVMSGVEIATSLVRGSDPTLTALPAGRDHSPSARAALERALLPALRRPPCLVAFSGGLDSSGILAAAVAAARTHNLPLPIPATNRFPGVAAVDESAWQELVIAHLGLSDWIRVDLTDELDVIGPVAAPGLLAHGVLWPPNAHFLGPLTARATGGTLLTGIGGDELFTPGASRGARVLAREVRPRRSDFRAIADALAPAPVRRRRLRAALVPPPWLRPEARRLWCDAIATDLSREPLWWGPGVLDSWWRSRSRLGIVRSIQATAGESVVVEHPYMSPEFLGALAAERWRTGFSSRRSALEFLLGELLPATVRARSDKTAFFVPFINLHSRLFIERWDGTGVDPELVDTERLRRCWDEDEVDARSYAALQAAWLASQPGQRESMVAC